MVCKNCSGTGMLRGCIDAETGLYAKCSICNGSGIEAKKYRLGIFIESDSYNHKIYLDMFNNFKLAKDIAKWFKDIYKTLTNFPEDKRD